VLTYAVEPQIMLDVSLDNERLEVRRCETATLLGRALRPRCVTLLTLRALPCRR
jgi:hypothetical protein